MTNNVNRSLCDIVNEIGKILIDDPIYIETYPQLKNLLQSPGPNPPNLWARAYTDCVNCQNTYCSDDTNVYPPLTCGCSANTIYITPEQLDMRRKAEIFKYKKNASDQTKKQKYSLLAKGINIYKKLSWATQSEYYTNPNVNKLPRVGYTLVCGNNTSGSQNSGNSSSGNSSPEIYSPANSSPTTNNNVPGPGMIIYYDKTIPLTNYVVRRQYTFNGTKWPQTCWKPGDNGFPVGKACNRLVLQ
jgi:hypothetical protein